jgi:PAS domain S-box-containing protein
MPQREGGCLTTADRITATEGAGVEASGWRQRALEGLATGRPLAEVLGLLARAQQAACPSEASCAFVIRDTVSGGPRLIAGPSLPDSLLDMGRNEAAGTAGAAFDIDAAVASLQAAAESHGLTLVRAHDLTDSDGTVAGALLLFRDADADPAPFAEDELVETVRLATLAITQSERRRRLERQARHFEDGQKLARLGTIKFDIPSDTWTVSRPLADHIGLDETALSREVARGIIHPDDLAMSLEKFQALFQHQGRLEYEHRLIHQRTGAVIFVKIFVGLVRDSRGEPLYVTGVVQDVSDHRRAMAALEASEARFRGLFDALPLDVALWRRSGDDFVLEDVNPAAERDCDDRIRPLLGSRLSLFYDDCPDLIACIHHCARDGTVMRLERPYRMRSTGRERHFAFLFAPVPPDAVMVIAEDIEDRIAFDACLRETTDLLEAGQRMGRMGSFEYHLADDRWRLSETWLDLFGADAASAKTDELIALVHPEDRAAVMNAFEAVRRGQATQLDHRGINRRTGAIIDVRSRYDLVRDESGQPLKIRGLTQDVTDEKRREQVLTDRLRQLDLAEAIASVGSWTLDPTTGIVQWSDNVYRIYERDPALGPPTLEDYERFYQGEALETLRTVLLGAVRDGKPYEVTIPLTFPDGRVKWLHALGRPEPDAGPHGHVVHGTLQDITERKRAEAFREDVDRVIRHDLRSPIAATMAGINLLRISGELSPSQRETLDMMERANQRQLTLLDTSMTLYRMEAGTYDLTTEPVDLLAVLEEVRAELTHLAVARHAAVRMDTPEPASMPPTPGDAWLCRAILSNLIRNALEAVPEGMTEAAVTIRLQAAGGQAVVTITNPGAVPEDIRPLFFEKYVTSGKSGGTGLGTYSARIMAEAQGGSVTLDSTRPDWTTVTVTLPLV